MREKARKRKRKSEVRKPPQPYLETLVFLPKSIYFCCLNVYLCKFLSNLKLILTCCYLLSTIWFSCSFWFSLAKFMAIKGGLYSSNDLILPLSDRVSSQLKLLFEVGGDGFQAGFMLPVPQL